jgi:hypothetical protein
MRYSQNSDEYQAANNIYNAEAQGKNWESDLLASSIQCKFTQLTREVDPGAYLRPARTPSRSMHLNAKMSHNNDW